MLDIFPVLYRGKLISIWQLFVPHNQKYIGSIRPCSRKTQTFCQLLGHGNKNENGHKMGCSFTPFPFLLLEQWMTIHFCVTRLCLCLAKIIHPPIWCCCRLRCLLCHRRDWRHHLQRASISFTHRSIKFYGVQSARVQLPSAIFNHPPPCCCCCFLSSHYLLLYSIYSLSQSFTPPLNAYTGAYVSKLSHLNRSPLLHTPSPRFNHLIIGENSEATNYNKKKVDGLRSTQPLLLLSARLMARIPLQHLSYCAKLGGNNSFQEQRCNHHNKHTSMRRQSRRRRRRLTINQDDTDDRLVLEWSASII